MTNDLPTRLLAAIAEVSEANWLMPVDPRLIDRLCQAHREIVKQFQRAWGKRNTGDERERLVRQAHAVALVDVVCALATAYGLEEPDSLRGGPTE